MVRCTQDRLSNFCKKTIELIKGVPQGLLSGGHITNAETLASEFVKIFLFSFFDLA